eukprot:166683_1
MYTPSVSGTTPSASVTHSAFPSTSITDNNINNNNNDENEIFDPLKGATNMRVKTKAPLAFKKNFAQKFFQQNNEINIDNKYENENNEENEENEDDNKNDNEHIDTPFNDPSLRWKGRQPSNTKMFGKYFDKRGSNISHNSIWSESSDDDDDDEFNFNKNDNEHIDTPFNDPSLRWKG